jgi:hypothetical protein
MVLLHGILYHMEDYKVLVVHKGPQVSKAQLEHKGPPDHPDLKAHKEQPVLKEPKEL